MALILRLISVAGAVEASTIRGGTGNDTVDFTGVVTDGLVGGGAGADSFSFNGATGTSILAGAGNDSVAFDGAKMYGTSTYYFGKTDGKDTLSFGSLTGSQQLVVAVDAAYGATSGIQFSGDLDAATGTSGTITFNNAEAGVATGTLFLNNVTGSSEAAGAGVSYITFVTVSTAEITALG